MKSKNKIKDKSEPKIPRPSFEIGGGYQKNAIGLYGNIMSYPNWGAYRPRVYIEQDSAYGIDQLSRRLLVRWARELVAQEAWIGAAIDLKASYAVGNAYDPIYIGNDQAWGKIATDWLKDEWYPNCMIRGNQYDFKTCLRLHSSMMDIDGDDLVIFGFENGFPKFQVIPTHRIQSDYMDNSIIESGPFKGYMNSDGIIYDVKTGETVGFNVCNKNNVVATLSPEDETPTQISARNAHLIFERKLFDKSRGIPSLGPAILAGLSLNELTNYYLEREKIFSTVALVEKTPSGEAPYQLKKEFEQLQQISNNFGVGVASPNVGGVRIMQGSDIRYIKSDGGEIKSLASDNPSQESQAFIKRLETTVLASLGVPHQLIFSPQDVGGKFITTSMVEIFRSSISRRQTILDKHSKFCISWALANAMKSKLIPENKQENLYKVFDVSHPQRFTVDEMTDRNSDLNDLNAGVKTMNDILKKYNKTSDQVIKERSDETMTFFKEANRIAKETNTDVNVVVAYMRSDLKVNIQALDNTSDVTKN